MDEKRQFSPIKQYFWNIIVSLDQTVNTILGGNPDTTISGRLGYWKREYPKTSWRYKVAYAICRLLHLFDPEHCKRSIEPDETYRKRIDEIQRFNRGHREN